MDVGNKSVGARLKRVVGAPVTGDRFWDREQEIPAFIELLREGAHVLLVAPRRVGKTSLMREVSRRVGGEFICLYIDLEASRTPLDAIVELGAATKPHQNLWKRTAETFRNTLANVESIGLDELKIKLRDGIGPAWQAKGERIFESLAASEQPVVVFIDELPILVSRLLTGEDRKVTPERVSQADAFVSFLRAACIKYTGKIRFVAAGSIGLQPVLRRAGLSAAINVFHAFDLQAWDAYAAIGCIEALAREYGVRLADGVPQRMVALLGSCVPHHVQMFFDQVYVDARHGSELAASVEDVERVFETSMLRNRGHAELSHYEERLAFGLELEAVDLAHDMLTEAAISGLLGLDQMRALASAQGRKAKRPVGFAVGGANSGELTPAVRDILDVLEHDGYLRKQGDHYVFVSELLRRWWKAKFEFGFVRASDRSGGP